jgi:hypothetical protein
MIYSNNQRRQNLPGRQLLRLQPIQIEFRKAGKFTLRQIWRRNTASRISMVIDARHIFTILI